MTSVGFRTSTWIRFLIVWLAVNTRAENVEIVTPENTKIRTEEPKNVTEPPHDSYVRAYEEVQKLRTGPAKRNDYEGDKQGGYDTVIRSSHVPDERYPSLTHQWTPSAPPALYGPPHAHLHHHEPPPHHHHHPDPPPPTHCHPIPYSSPSTSFLGFLPKKLSLKLLLKVLLKLVLFKMIVKFIAVVCLLLFIPVLKSKETSSEQDDERRRSRALETMAEAIWAGIESQNSIYGEDGEVKDVEEIAVQMDDDDNGEENFFAGPEKAVRFLEFCVSTVDRVVGFVLGVLQRQRNGGGGLAGFIFEKLRNFVKNI